MRSPFADCNNQLRDTFFRGKVTAIEGNATKQKGMEYVVETENGNLMTIVLGIDPIFVARQKVLVIYGSSSRMIADPRSAQ
ncbi:MAG TPA: hypothetical protein DCQ77_01635 [Betaproteobacteria bacterium]|nr:hypothetical protein [Betaproteobacteria bacterium]